MDIEDILYLLFVLGSILLSLFGKKKKRGQKPAQNNNPFDLNFELFNKNDDQTQPEPEPAQPENFHESSEIETNETPRTTNEKNIASNRYNNPEYLNLVRERKKKSVRIKRSTASDSPIFDEDLTLPEKEEAFEFDARKAIIYSEILKRPE